MVMGMPEGIPIIFFVPPLKKAFKNAICNLL